MRILLKWNTKSKKTGNDQELMQLNPTSLPHLQKTSTVNRMDAELFPKQVVIQLPQLKAIATSIFSLFVLIYFKPFFLFLLTKQKGPEVIKLFSCSTQLSMKFFPLTNVKMPTVVGILTLTVGILTFMSGKNSILGLCEPKKAEFLDIFILMSN